MQNTIVFFQNGLGDFFLNLPTIRALLQIFGSELTLLTGHLYSNQLLNNSGVKNIERINITMDFEKRFDLNRFKEIVSNYDLFINLNPWFPIFCKEDYINFIKNINSVCFHNSCANKIPHVNSLNAFDYSFRIAQYFQPCMQIDDFALPPNIDKKSQNFINSFRQDLHQDSYIIAIQDWTSREKMFPTNFFDILIEDLKKEYPTLIILILGNQTAVKKEVIDNERVFFWGNNVSFDFQCSIVSIIDYFIGIDSVFLHVADLYRKKVLGFFGPSSEVLWGNRFGKGKIIKASSSKLEDIDYQYVIHEIKSVINTCINTNMKSN